MGKFGKSITETKYYKLLKQKKKIPSVTFLYSQKKNTNFLYRCNVSFMFLKYFEEKYLSRLPLSTICLQKLLLTTSITRA